MVQSPDIALCRRSDCCTASLRLVKGFRLDVGLFQLFYDSFLLGVFALCSGFLGILETNHGICGMVAAGYTFVSCDLEVVHTLRSHSLESEKQGR